MSDEQKCLRCGGNNLVSGSFQSTGKVYFRPEGAKLLTIHSSGAVVDAKTCFDCGHVELLVNTNQVRSLTKNS